MFHGFEWDEAESTPWWASAGLPAQPLLDLDFERGTARRNGLIRDLDQIMGVNRATPATYVDAEGALKSAPINAPRFDYSGGKRALLLEAAATNLLATQTFVSHAGTGLNRGSVTASGVFPAVCTFSPLTGTVPHYAYLDPTSLSVTAGVTYAISVWIGTPAPFAFVSGGSTGFGTNQWLVINTATGEIVHAQNCTGRTSAFDGGWQVTILVVATATTSSASIATGTSNGSNVRLPSFVSADPFVIFGAQVEVGDTPTSYIPTEGTAVTRAADIAAPIDLSGFDLSGGYTVVMKGRLEGVSSLWDTLINLDDGTSANRQSIAYNRAQSKIRAQAWAGNVVASMTEVATPLPFDARCAFSVRADSFDYAQNGVAAPHDSAVIYAPPEWMRIGVGVSSNQTPSRLRVSRVSLYPTVMTAAQLAEATA